MFALMMLFSFIENRWDQCEHPVVDSGTLKSLDTDDLFTPFHIQLIAFSFSQIEYAACLHLGILSSENLFIILIMGNKTLSYLNAN